MTLTDPMLLLLRRIRVLKEKHGADGLFPRRTQWQTLRALKRRGLVKFVGAGRDIDGLFDDDVPIYDMTQAGEEALAKFDPKEGA